MIIHLKALLSIMSLLLPPGHLLLSLLMIKVHHTSGDKSVTHHTKNVNKYYNDLGNKCVTDVDFDINCSVNNKNNNIYHDTISKGNINNDDINITINDY